MLIVEQVAVPSKYLKRYVIVDLFLPKSIADPFSLSLLLLNDGQHTEEMALGNMLNGLMNSGAILPLVIAGIHANKDRMKEYGTAGILDYEGRGDRAGAYQSFITKELLPFIQNKYAIPSFRSKAFAGFSLGGLSAIDTVWNHPLEFSIAGVFSGSLWWRTKALGTDYNDATDRIMHERIREGAFHPGLRFYFVTGSLDETADRNNNGIIDSIDDTLDLIKEIKAHGYEDDAISYINYEDGRHDIATWTRAMEPFLRWGWEGDVQRGK